MNPPEPKEILSRLAASGLRGRGGGWFPAARKWQAVSVEGGAACVIANGAEGEPGSIKDRFVMTRYPERVLEGLALAARALGAREAILYLKGSFTAAADALQAALGALGPGLDARVQRGEESYVVGEETALLESLEGRRAWPRPKPPLPAAVGLYGRPTLVQNVETLARAGAAVADPEAFRRSEATFVSLWGDVRRPGVYDVPLGTPLGRVIEQWGEGPTEAVGMLFPAGPSGAPLTAAELDAPLDPDALEGRGSALGTAALLVVGASACPLAVAASLASFFERESCGQCPPCSVGTARLAQVIRAVEAGGARPRDLTALAEAAGFMAGHGYCAHTRVAAASLTGLLARFRDDVEAHLATGSCPRGSAAARDPFGPGSPERTAIEAALVQAVA